MVFTNDVFNIENNDADSSETSRELTNLILKKLKRYKKSKEEYAMNNPKEYQFDELNEKPKDGMYVIPLKTSLARNPSFQTFNTSSCSN